MKDNHCGEIKNPQFIKMCNGWEDKIKKLHIGIEDYNKWINKENCDKLKDADFLKQCAEWKECSKSEPSHGSSKICPGAMDLAIEHFKNGFKGKVWEGIGLLSFIILPIACCCFNKYNATATQ